MSILQWLETDSLTNQNISSATAIGSYTSDADRSILVDVSVDQVAGNGDYIMYVTRQIGGAGSSYVVLPKTTMTAASGETSISGQSGIITVRIGDILTVYIDGLAGDTTTPDTIVRWYDLTTPTPLNAAQTAAAVLDAVAANYNDPGTIGEAINSSGASGDPLNSTVPGSYAPGTAGYILGTLDLTTGINVVSPVALNGDVETYQGTDYLNADGNALEWTDVNDIWPVTLNILDTIIVRVGDQSIPAALITGSSHGVVRCEPTRTQTFAIGAGKHEFWVLATQPDGDIYPPLVVGTWTSHIQEY